MNCTISDDESDKQDGDDHPDVDELKSVSLDIFSDKDIHLNSLVVLTVLVGMDSGDGMGGKSCVGSMGSSFVVLTAGVGQNAGVESTLMVVSPLKSRMGENGVKEIESIECVYRMKLCKKDKKGKKSIYIILIDFFDILC